MGKLCSQRPTTHKSRSVRHGLPPHNAAVERLHSSDIAEHSPTSAAPSRLAASSVRLSVMVLDNDEIEVACDVIWFVKSRGAVDDVQQQLWDRLQTLRSGDYGGSAGTKLEPGEVSATLRALHHCADQIPLDDDERRLLVRLESL